MIELRPIQPGLLTREEAARYLRLDEGRDLEKAIKSLYRYVDRGELRAAIVGRNRRFSLRELDRFIEAKTDESGVDPRS